MAKRKIRLEGDEILSKISKPVTSITPAVITLLEDMKDTLYSQEAVGIAAVQVGSLKRIALIDIGEGLTELINPEITASEGSAESREGCLSVPGYIGYVERPEKLTVKYLDRNMDEQTLECEGYMAQAVCHEVDHMNGILLPEISFTLEDTADGIYDYEGI